MRMRKESAISTRECPMKETIGLGLLLTLLARPAGAQEVKLRSVKYGELARLVATQKGKVVVVDFWATWCGPCKAAFPHLVELHQQYARQGLVVISVSLDDAKDPQTVDEVRAFLRHRKATMTN